MQYVKCSLHVRAYANWTYKRQIMLTDPVLLVCYLPTIRLAAIIVYMLVPI